MTRVEDMSFGHFLALLLLAFVLIFALAWVISILLGGL